MNIKKTVLLTGGRAPATLELARSFHAHGHKVLVVESVLHHICRFSQAVAKSFLVRKPNQDPQGFIDDLLKIVRDEKVDLLVPTCEEVFFVSRGLERLKEHCLVLVDRPEKLAQLHSKWAFNELVRGMGLRAPASRLVYNHQELKESVKDILSDSSSLVVVKPAFSRFASKIFIFNAPHEQDLRGIDVHSHYPWVVQEFIEGREFCSYGIARDGELLVHSIYDHEFTAGKGAGICFEAIDHKKILNWVRNFVKSQNFTGQIAFDFIETKEGEIYPLECNPRATSGIHLFDYDQRVDLSLLGTKQSTVLARPGSLSKLGLAMWVYGLPSARNLKRFASWWKVFREGREVIFSFADPKPFFYQFVCLFYLWRQSLKSGLTILEASTQDIEWNGVG